MPLTQLMAAALAFALPAWALVFPLPLNERGEYDVDHNVLPSYRAAWTNGHAILNLHGANAVAIAPHWFLTASHLVVGKDSSYWVNDDGQRYYMLEKHEVGYDLSLVRVDREFPVYSELRKKSVQANEIFKIYGQSPAGGEPAYNGQGKHIGWKLAPLDHFPQLRWGQGRPINSDNSWIQWRFNAGDEALGSGGLNCAGTATNDSGGGLFIGRELAGVIIGGSFAGYRTNALDPVGSCDGSKPGSNAGHIFATNGLLQCSGSGGVKAFATASAVYPALSNIFAWITPPIRVNAGGPALTNSLIWQSWMGSGAQVFSDGSFVVNTDEIPGPAPLEVYRSELYLNGQPNEAITFEANELIRYETYTVRLHFSPLNTINAPEISRQKIEVNGQTVTLDPFAGPGKASEYTFYEVTPDEQNRIRIAISPANEFGNAAVSGIELKVTPRWPTDNGGFTWLARNYGPVAVYGGRAVFGNGVVVAFTGGGTVFSEDNGQTWHQSVGGPRSLSNLLFGNGVFMMNEGNSIFVSSNGRVWESIPQPDYLQNITFGNGAYVAFFIHSIRASTNGLDWQTVYSGQIGAINGVFGNGKFLVDLSPTNALTSLNGFDWERISQAVPPTLDPRCEQGAGCDGPPPSWWFTWGLAFGDGIFAKALEGIAQTNSETGPRNIRFRCLFVSEDGINWRYPGDGSPKFSPVFGPVNFVDGWFVSPISRMESTNLVDFRVTPGTPKPTLASGNEAYVRIEGNVLSAGTSVDKLIPIPNPIRERVFSSVAVDAQTSRVVVINTDKGSHAPLLFAHGDNAFTRCNSPGEAALERVRFVGERFVAVGAAGTTLTSTDGIDWGAAAADSTQDIHDVAFGANRWVAVGHRGTVLTATTEPFLFKRALLATDATLHSIVFDHGMFAAVGDRGTTAISTDGQKWELGKAFAEDLLAITYGAGRFVAVGENGIIATSSNGTNWRKVRGQAGQSLSQVAYGNGRFLALEQNSTNGLFSRDGISWALTAVPIYVKAITGSDLHLWAAGSPAYIAVNTPLMTISSNGAEIHTVTPGEGAYEIWASDSPGGGEWRFLTNINRASDYVWRETQPAKQRFFKVVRKP